jgi:hypothetical protein
MDILNIPRPAWMSEDLVLLDAQKRRWLPRPASSSPPSP